MQCIFCKSRLTKIEVDRLICVKCNKNKFSVYLFNNNGTVSHSVILKLDNYEIYTTSSPDYIHCEGYTDVYSLYMSQTWRHIIEIPCYIDVFKLSPAQLTEKIELYILMS
jgi:hypothetical protein